MMTELPASESVVKQSNNENQHVDRNYREQQRRNRRTGEGKALDIRLSTLDSSFGRAALEPLDLRTGDLEPESSDARWSPGLSA